MFCLCNLQLFTPKTVYLNTNHHTSQGTTLHSTATWPSIFKEATKHTKEPISVVRQRLSCEEKWHVDSGTRGACQKQYEWNYEIMMFSPCCSMPRAIPQWNYKRCTACSHIENEIKAGKFWKMHYHPHMKNDGNASQNKLQSGMISNADNIMIVWSVSLHLLYIEKTQWNSYPTTRRPPASPVQLWESTAKPRSHSQKEAFSSWQPRMRSQFRPYNKRPYEDIHASPLACRTPSCRNEKGDNVEIQCHHVSWTYLAKEPKDWTCLKTFHKSGMDINYHQWIKENPTLLRVFIANQDLETT